MTLESIEYIENNPIVDFSSQVIASFLNELKQRMLADFSSGNRKIGKFLLYLRYPAYKETIQENTNSLDFNIFTMCDVAKKIEQSGYGYIFSGKWGK